MTARWRQFVSCPNCDHPVSTEPAFNAWVRTHPDLDSRADCIVASDLDLLVHRYGTRRDRGGIDRSVRYLMHVEVKTNGADVDPSQSETLSMYAAAMRSKPFTEKRDSGRFTGGHPWNYRPFIWRGVQVMYFGVHLLQLSGLTPEDSALLKWDRQPITVEQLVGLLRFDLSPDTLNVMEHRQHKRRRRQMRLPIDD